MKDFFEDLGKRLGETAETMTNKAGDAIEIQRLKSQVRTLARGNAVDLMELGRMIYDRYKGGEEVEEAFRPICEAVQNREKSMEDYEKKIARIKGAAECSHCGKMVAKNMVYCPYCGEKIENSIFEEEEASEEDIFKEDIPAEDMVKEDIPKEDISEENISKGDSPEENARKEDSHADERKEKTAE